MPHGSPKRLNAYQETDLALVEDGIATDPVISEKTRRLQEAAHATIPGGGHTYAKGDDQYPTNAPPLITRGLGCHVWDPDGNEFSVRPTG